MSKISFIIGIVAFGIFIIGLIPCLGWMNWISWPLALTGCVMNAITVIQEAIKGADGYIDKSAIIKSIIAFVLCIGVLIIGPIRLMFGGGLI